MDVVIPRDSPHDSHTREKNHSHSPLPGRKMTAPAAALEEAAMPVVDFVLSRAHRLDPCSFALAITTLAGSLLVLHTPANGPQHEPCRS